MKKHAHDGVKRSVVAAMCSRSARVDEMSWGVIVHGDGDVDAMLIVVDEDDDLGGVGDWCMVVMWSCLVGEYGCEDVFA